ncbi:MAG: arylesterase [Pseudohongiellaceae bacterium]
MFNVGQMFNVRRITSDPTEKYTLTPILTLLLLSVCSLGLANEPGHTVMVYGDSLSAAYGIEQNAGWVNLLEQKLEAEKLPFRVVNGSVSGETTTGGLARLPAMLEAYRPDILLLALGGNDGLRGLPLESIRENLLAMIDLARNAGIEVVLAGIQIPPNYGPRYAEPFYQQYQEIALETGVPLIPFLIDGIPQQPQLMQDDGIHPRAEAQFMILDNVWPVLQPQLEKQIATH